MDFSTTEEQNAIFDMAYAFGQEHIAPFARDWEAQGTIPKDLWPKVAELGLAGIYVTEEHGGSGLSRLDATLVFEALSMACPAVASFLSIHNMCGGMIDKFGSDAAKAKWLPSLCRMDRIFSYCLTEPGSGSDAAALRTRAVHGDAGYVLNGTKAFISGGGYSDAYICMVRTGENGPRGISAMVVEAGSAGLSYGALEDKMGWRAQRHWEARSRHWMRRCGMQAIARRLVRQSINSNRCSSNWRIWRSNYRPRGCFCIKRRGNWMQRRLMRRSSAQWQRFS